MSEKVLGFRKKDALFIPLSANWLRLKVGETNLVFLTEEKLVPVVSLKALKEWCNEKTRFYYKAEDYEGGIRYILKELLIFIEKETRHERLKKDLLSQVEKEAGKK